MSTLNEQGRVSRLAKAPSPSVPQTIGMVLIAILFILGVSVILYLPLSFFGLPVRWQGEQDLREFYRAVSRGDVQAATAVIAPAHKGKVPVWMDFQSGEHGRPRGIEITSAATEADLGQHGIIFYRVRFPDGAVEHGSAMVWRWQPLDLPPLTIEEQIRICHINIRNDGEIIFGSVSQIYGNWSTDYVVARPTGVQETYRAFQGIAQFVAYQILPDGSRGAPMAC